MALNEHGRQTTASNLSAFSTMALIVQLLRSVKERCAQEARELVPPDDTGQVEPCEQDGESFLDKSGQSC